MMLAKTPSESRTIRRARLYMVLSAVLATLPDLIGFALAVVTSNPELAEKVRNIVPPQYRYVFGIVLAAVADEFRRLRYSTSTPIIKD